MDNHHQEVISCRDVWKLYGERPEKYLARAQEIPSYETLQEDGYIAAVRGVSLKIYRGESLVVMGLSGSGKSTLLRCFTRLISLTKGVVKIEGEDIASLGTKKLIALRLSKMGMVFQNFALLPHRTVLDNVVFPLEMRGQDRHQRRERAFEMIKLVGLEGREDYFPRELSGGQQQRVGIARSLVIEPDIWFLDEPFSALDPLIRREMQDEFLRLQEMLGKTIIFITHDFDEALRLADRIAVMKDGAIEQIDTPDKIVLSPATEYVAKFTRDIEKARIVHVGTLLETSKFEARGKANGMAVKSSQTIFELGRMLVNDQRDIIPVMDSSGKIAGGLSRKKALDILFEADVS